MSEDTVKIDLIEDISEIPEDEWDALVGDFPFFKYTFLHGLAQTGCATAETGWLPRFVVARDREGRLTGAIPLYIKGHSMGEFVYDWAWADAAQRMGVQYYPKAIVAAPFTPATSQRILTYPGLEPGPAAKLRSQLAGALRQVGEAFDLSGTHVLFCQDADAEALTDRGFFIRRHHQYHWKNHGYESFDDFLEPFKSKRRKEIRRQRRRLAEEGVTVEVFGEDTLTSELRDFAWTCYLSTIEKFPWGRQYLTPAFYEWIFDSMHDSIRLFVAFSNDRTMLGSALTFIGGDTLYGRYWGCVQDVSYLHFETCLYAPIEFAIKHGLKTIEPGQGGEHKFARGFEATVTQSAHWIADDQFEHVLRRHTAQEGQIIVSEVEQMNVHSSFQPEEDDSTERGEDSGKGENSAEIVNIDVVDPSPERGEDS